MAIIVFLLMDKVSGWTRPASFEEAVSRVSRDFSSFNFFFFFLPQFLFFFRRGGADIVSPRRFLPPRQILADLELDPGRLYNITVL